MNAEKGIKEESISLSLILCVCVEQTQRAISINFPEIMEMVCYDSNVPITLGVGVFLSENQIRRVSEEGKTIGFTGIIPSSSSIRPKYSTREINLWKTRLLVWRLCVCVMLGFLWKLNKSNIIIVWECIES